MKIESKHLFLIALIAFVSYLFLNSSLFKTLTTFESFQNNERDELEKKILDHPDLENAHGSAPAGVNALPGDIQFKLNTLSEYVNPMYKDGNPQNTNNLLKKQP